MRTAPPLLAPIFRSDGQARILAELLLPGQALTIVELAERTGLAYATVHREVMRLVEAGILAERTVGRAKVISADADSPLIAPLRQILAVVAGPVPALRAALETVDGVRSAFLYGSFAERLTGEPGPVPQDIDVMVVGTPDPQRVYQACAHVEEQVHRPVNPTVLTPEEFSQHSGFLETVRSRPTVHVLGERLWR